jgi:hypothetical protein
MLGFAPQPTPLRRNPMNVGNDSLPCDGRGGLGWGCLCFSASLNFGGM